jgi:hypothetical protein
MPAIDTTTQERIPFYLGYTSQAVPWGDRALLRRALDRTDYNNWELSEIGKQVDRCQRTWEEIEEASDDVAYRRIIIGDVNRTDTEFRSEKFTGRKRAFIFESDQLAATLGVRNYRNPANAEYLHYGLPNP